MANGDDENQHKIDATYKTTIERYRASWWLGVLGALLAFVTLVAALFSIGKVLPSLNNQSIPYQLEQQQKQIEALKVDVAAIKAQVNILQTDIQNYDRPGGQPSGLQLKAITDTLTNLQARIVNLDSVILDNPTKALTVPLLRKDLDSLKDSYQANTVVTKSDIDRIYDLNKWFIGLMRTSTVGIIALAVSNFLKRT